MDRSFVKKRIQEQNEYIERTVNSDSIPIGRRLELVTSAVNQKLYFINKLREMSEKKSSVEKVKEFHEMFEHPIGSITSLEPLNIRQLRIKLLFEELAELAEAGDVRETMFSLCHGYVVNNTARGDDFDSQYSDGDNVNKKEELDAITDIQYVLDGKKLTSGLYEVCDEAFDLIHENNMQKAHRDLNHIKETSEKTGVHLTCVIRNGVYIAQNPDGKTTKPWDHKKVTLNHLVPTV